MKNKHIHFIGICGVAMSALAIAFNRQNYKVTGSDAGFFPPVSDNLKKNKINFYPGWHIEKMIKNGDPDLVIVGNVANSTNPEWKYVQENNLNYLSYPEVIAKYFIKSNSIVCAGTYGKTSTSALLSWIMTQNNYKPSYMFGGLTVNEKFNSASLGNQSKANWSILEGDEYKTARWDMSPKFSYYSPTHLLLTAIEWDHADIYPTEKSYFEIFKVLIKNIPKKGLIIASENISNSIIQLSNCAIFTYGSTKKSNYQYYDVRQTKDNLTFKIKYNSQIYKLKSKMLGNFMAKNITGCFALAHQIGLKSDNIIKAITNFNGIKRRLQKRGQINDIDIYDDIAHSPAKAESTLQTLKSIYSNGKIYAIFEPNTGNRQLDSKNSYINAFLDADKIIIPKLSKIKIDPNKPPAMDGQKITKIINQTHNNAIFIEEDEKLINYLKEKTQPNDVIVFLGSHGFRGMIEKLIISLRQ